MWDRVCDALWRRLRSLFRAWSARLGCARAALGIPWDGPGMLLGLLGAGGGCREPELSHKPLAAAVLWEQPEMAQQRLGKLLPEWSPGSLTGGHLEPSPISVTECPWDATLRVWGSAAVPVPEPAQHLRHPKSMWEVMLQGCWAQQHL